MQVCRARGSLRDKERIANALAEAGNDYIQKVDRIKAFTRKRRIVSRLQNERFEWTLEHKRLREHAEGLEKGIARGLRGLVDLSSTEGDTDMIAAVQRLNSLAEQQQESRDVVAATVMDQMRQLRSVLHQVAAAQQAQTSTERKVSGVEEAPEPPPEPQETPQSSDAAPNPPEPPEAPKQQRAAAVEPERTRSTITPMRGDDVENEVPVPAQGQDEAVEEQPSAEQIVPLAASMLLQTHEGHDAHGHALHEQATALEQECQAAQSSVTQLLKQERDSQEAQQFTRVFHLMPAELGDGCSSFEDLPVSIQCDMLALRQQLEARMLDQLREQLAETRELQTAFVQKAANATAAGSVDAANSRTGGWSAADHGLFVQLFKQFRHSGRPRGQFIEMAQAQLPEGMSTSEIKCHERWFELHRSYNRRKKECSERHTQAKQDLMAECRQAYVNALEEAKSALSKRAEIEELDQRRDALAETLKKLRAQRAEQEEANQLQRRKEEEAAAAEQAKRDAAEMERRMMDKAQLAEYQAEKDRARRAELEAALQAQEEEHLQRQERMSRNAPRIEFRAGLKQAKDAEREQAQLQLLLEEQRRQELLERLAQQVPYYDRIQAAQADVHKTTHAVDAWQFDEVEHGHETARGHAQRYGFADEKLFQDARFRLGLALRQAGVHNTAAARATIERLHPRPQAPI